MPVGRWIFRVLGGWDQKINGLNDSVIPASLRYNRREETNMNKTNLSAPDRIKFLPEIALKLDPLEVDGLTLNLAHGGEDMIGKMIAGRVVAVNVSQKELKDVHPDSLRIVMSPCDLKFLDASFELVTAFFAMLFIGCDQYGQMFKEAFRVLKPGGRFLFWDAVIPSRDDTGRDIIAVPVRVRMGSQVLTAGYGALWPHQAYQPDIFKQMALEAGFDIQESDQTEAYFFMDLFKTRS